MCEKLTKLGSETACEVEDRRNREVFEVVADRYEGSEIKGSSSTRGYRQRFRRYDADLPREQADRRVRIRGERPESKGQPSFDQLKALADTREYWNCRLTNSSDGIRSLSSARSTFGGLHKP